MSLLSHAKHILSDIYASWVMVGIISALRTLGGGLHGCAFELKIMICAIGLPVGADAFIFPFRSLREWP